MEEKKRVSSSTELPHEILEAAYKAGIDAKEEERSGTFMYVDHSLVLSQVNKRFKGKLELLDTTEALKKYSWLREYYWRLIDADKDEYTRMVDEKSGGYFMRILPGAKIEFPLQSCLMISSSGLKQRVHNIIIAEEGSEARVITGCTAHTEAKSSQHVSVSEFYIKKGARLSYTMIHTWSRDTLVRPRSVARLEDDSTFISNYVLLNPVKDLRMYPMALCDGINATAGLNSIVYASRGSGVDIGSGIEFNAPGCRGEIISRVIAKEESMVTARGIIKGNTSPAKGHLECKGLLLDDSSIIHAIPELVGARKDVELSHEAAVGKIAEKEITYLMSRGLSRDDATSIIIKGFLDVDILGLPADLQRAVRDIVDKMADAM
ncbi:MAG: SufD family Fe-S cluster assembly protein [Candidatus Altiarchaeota archaeon]|nr:SufD family Fe-S cluster assembly protein [Candidatus Altiarchaeota archaeon]